MPTWRTFIAVELDQAVKAELQRVRTWLGDQVPARTIRWVNVDGIHLTLKFLGDTPTDRVADVEAALARVADATQPFTVTIGGVGCFPNARQPRVVWVGVQEATGDLLRLQEAVEAQVAPLGFPTERRPFSPHLTLGRVQRYASGSEARRIGEVVLASSVGTLARMQALEVSYIKSDLQPSGAVYTTLLAAKFGGI